MTAHKMRTALKEWDEAHAKALGLGEEGLEGAFKRQVRDLKLAAGRAQGVSNVCSNGRGIDAGPLCAPHDERPNFTITSSELLMFALLPASQVFKDLPAALQSLIMAKSYTLYSLLLQPVGTVQGGNAGHPLLQHEVSGAEREGGCGGRRDR